MKLRTVAGRSVAVARAARAPAASTIPARQRIDGRTRRASLLVARDVAVPVSAPRARVQPTSVELRPMVFRSRGTSRPTAPAVTSAKQKLVTVKIRTAGSWRIKRRPAATSRGSSGLVTQTSRPVRTAAISAAARTSEEAEGPHRGKRGLAAGEVRRADHRGDGPEGCRVGEDATGSDREACREDEGDGRGAGERPQRNRRAGRRLDGVTGVHDPAPGEPVPERAGRQPEHDERHDRHRVNQASKPDGVALAQDQPRQRYAGDADRQGVKPLRAEEQAHVPVPEQGRAKPESHRVTLRSGTVAGRWAGRNGGGELKQGGGVAPSDQLG